MSAACQARAAAERRCSPADTSSQPILVPVAKAEERGLERLILFSDAVVAIAITLLVLPLADLEPGETESAWSLLRAEWDEIFAFFISFVVIARFWFSHHRIFRNLISHDATLLVLNAAWLASVVLMPFTTAVLSGGTGYTALYLFNLIVTSALTTALAGYINAHPHLLEEALPAATVRRNLIGGIALVATFVVALIVSFFIEHTALLCLLLIPVVQRIVHRLVPRRSRQLGSHARLGSGLPDDTTGDHEEELAMDAFYSTTILGAPIYLILWFFLVYAFFGVLVEMIFCLAQEGVLESRLGLLYVPLSPIYGIGAVALTQFLFRYFQQPVLLFVMGIVVGTVLEYVASFVMEKLFGTLFWDYSDKPFNLHGRICLQYSLYWGMLSLLVLYLLDPIVLGFVNLFSPTVGQAVLTVLVVLTVLSIVLTLASFARIRRRVSVLEAQARGEQVAEAESGWDRLVGRLAPDPVMINTFPRMSLMVEYMDLTGQQRVWIRVRGHLGRPPQVHRKMAERALEQARGAFS